MKGCCSAFLYVPIAPDSSPWQPPEASPALIIVMGHLPTRTLGLKLFWNSHRRVPDKVQSLWKSPWLVFLFAGAPQSLWRKAFDELVSWEYLGRVLFGFLLHCFAVLLCGCADSLCHVTWDIPPAWALFEGFDSPLIRFTLNYLKRKMLHMTFLL